LVFIFFNWYLFYLELFFIFFIKLDSSLVFSIKFYLLFFLLAFACFFMNIFIPISFFKIKLIENYTFWLNPSKKFNGMRLLKIRLGLRGLSVLPCFFFLFSRLMFSYFFKKKFCFFFRFDSIGLVFNNFFIFHPSHFLIYHITNNF
jgi:hypothetical protein